MRPKVSIVNTLYVWLYVMLLWNNIEAKVYLVYDRHIVIDISACLRVVYICCHVSSDPICQCCWNCLVWIVFLELVNLIWLYLNNLSWDESWCVRWQDLLWNELCLTCATKQKCLECEVECCCCEVILRAIHLIWVLFTYRVRHYHLVVHLYPFKLGMLAGHIYVTVEEHHEVWSNLVDVWWILCNYRDIICYINRHRSHQLVASVRRWDLIFHFVVQIIEAVTISRISSSIYDDHRDFEVSALFRVLKVLQYTRPLAKHTWHLQLCLISFWVCAAYADIAEQFFEQDVRDCQFGVIALKFHTTTIYFTSLLHVWYTHASQVEDSHKASVCV